MRQILEPQKLGNFLYRGQHIALDIFKSLKLASTGKLTKMPMRLITDEFAFSLAPEGWNYYYALLTEYARNADVTLETTSFFRFFMDSRVRAVRHLNDLLFLHNPDKLSGHNEFKFYLGTWPWGGLTAADSVAGGTPFGWYYDRVEEKMTRDLWEYGRNLWYEPGDVHTLEVEMDLTIRLYHSLKKGYRPLRYGSFPSVTLLVRRDGQRRAIILDGHHRLSVLSYLGYEQVTVGLMQVVEEAQVEQWYYVKHKDCPREEALEIFNAFFVLNGRERITYLNLDED